MSNFFAQYINLTDILLLILLIRTSYIGRKDGLTNEIYKILAVIISLAVMVFYYKTVEYILTEFLFVPERFSSFVSLLLLFGLSLFLLKVLFNITRKFMRLECNPSMDSVGGVVAGFLRGGLLAAIVLYIMLKLPWNFVEKVILKNSYIANILVTSCKSICKGIITTAS